MAAKKRRRVGRPPGRGEDVVDAILDATVRDLRVGGFAQLSVVRIAADAGVTRTSIYRRYPRREDLVAAALERVHTRRRSVRISGDLRTDLLRIAKASATLASTPALRAAAAALLATDEHRLAAVAERFTQGAVSDIARAFGRRAPSRERIELASEVLHALILHRAFWRKATIDEATLGLFVEVVVAVAIRRRKRF